MTEPNTLERVTRVRERHDRKLLARPGVVGVGTGRARTDPRPSPEADDYVIVVSVRSPRDLPRSPVVVEGVPVRFEVTGPIRAL